MEDLEKKPLAGGNENKSRIVPVSAFPDPVLVSSVPVTAFTGQVKLSTYDGKTNWEIYNTQFSIISEANGWTEGVKACQQAASLRGEAAEVLQTLPDTERQMKKRLQKTGESLQEYASKAERLVNLTFSDHPATVREIISLQYFVDDLKEREI
ncbi:uncharacterized protein TNCV_608061 [Trichonephila clavipes]|nr:uncharacterized protein TNCV_608061 [Trichonephila clavipes]